MNIRLSITDSSGTRGAHLRGAVNATAASGVARFPSVSIDSVGTNYRLTAQADSLVSATSNAFDITSAPASNLSVRVQPSSVVAGSPIAPAVEVAIRDSLGNTVRTATIRVTIAIGANPGGGTLSGATSLDPVLGVASFSDLSIDKASAGYTLQVSASGLPTVTTDSFRVSPGPANLLRILTQPSSTIFSRVVFGRQPVIEVCDRFGNSAALSGVSVAASIGSGGGTLAGTDVVQTDTAGRAAFSGLSIEGTFGDRTLQFRSAGLSSAMSDTLVLMLPPGSRLAIVTQPSQEAQSGVPLVRQPTLQLLDSTGSPTRQSLVPIRASLNGPDYAGGILLTGDTTVETDSTGRAAFSDLTIIGLPWPRYSLYFDTKFIEVGQFPWSNYISLGLAPAGPVNLTATALSESVLGLQWVDSSTDETGFQIDRCTGAMCSAFARVASVGAGVAFYRDTGLIANTTYQYRVAAYNMYGASAYSNAASATTQTTAPSVPNLSISGLYLTQGTQTFAGTVPLIADRPALLRVFVESDIANTLMPEVGVRLYQDGFLVQTYNIGASATSVPVVADEGILSSSWNIRIPSTLVRPGLSVLASVDPNGLVTETDKSDNAFPADGQPLHLDVRSAPTFQVTLVPVLFQSSGLVGDVTDANKGDYLDLAYRLYPLSSYDVKVRAPYTFSDDPTSGGESSRLLNEVAALRLADGSTSYYYGVFSVAGPSSMDVSGVSFLGAPEAIGLDANSMYDDSISTVRASVAAHEWGHNFGRWHVDCGNPSLPDPAYPYPNGLIGAYGFDLTKNVVRSPAGYYDIMSYCGSNWISDYTYIGVMNARGPAGVLPTTTSPQPSLLVWGRIGPESAVLEPSFQVTAPPSLPKRPGPYHVEARDSAGNLLFDVSFEGAQVDHRPGERQFAFTVPLAGESPPPAELRLYADGNVVVRRRNAAAVNAAPPARSATGMRVAGRTRIEWNSALFPMAMVRDAQTGAVRSFARGGAVDLGPTERELEVTLSDGVASVRTLVSVPR